MAINAQYNVAAPDSLPVKIAGYQRRKMFLAFLKETAADSMESVLDVGATADQSYDHSNYLASWYEHKSRITAVGIDDAEFLESQHPGLKFVRADGRDLPFEDKSYDVVHSSAVLEHVGNRAMQVKFLSEMWRVSRKSIFITTPNRWFPVEFHTVLPLLHWLPPKTYRKILKQMGKDFFADENNLNLLSPQSLADAARQAGISKFRIATVSLLGLPTNLLLIAHKEVH